MKFREFESTPPSAAAPAETRQSRFAATLSLTGNGKDGTDGKTAFVWSATAQTAKANDSISAASGDANIIKAVELKMIQATTKVRRLCQDLFLPVGYPASVSDGYLEYQFYDSLQGLCSYLRGVVSTSAVLSATGVGDAKATALSAAMVCFALHLVSQKFLHCLQYQVLHQTHNNLLSFHVIWENFTDLGGTRWSWNDRRATL